MNVFKGDLPPGIASKLRKKDSSFRYSEDYNRMHGSCHGLFRKLYQNATLLRPL